MTVFKDKASVLILEDDSDLATMTKISLEKVGFNVQITSSVSEGIFRAERQAFDCITLDLRLEKGSGIQFLDFIRTNKKNLNHNTPVIITSGYIDAAVLQKLKGDVNSVLIKPFTQAQLIEKIQSLLQAHQNQLKIG